LIPPLPVFCYIPFTFWYKKNDKVKKDGEEIDLSEGHHCGMHSIIDVPLLDCTNQAFVQSSFIEK